jgi:putative IMPACT (imprinted ancient) family translation regulator
MKSKPTNEVRVDGGGVSTLSVLCLMSCRKILAQIRKAKEAILAEARGTLDAHERMLQLALNEAEALAWQTEYPERSNNSNRAIHKGLQDKRKVACGLEP